MTALMRFGRTEIGKIERLFDMEIEADDFTTIAGFVIAQKEACRARANI